MSKSDVNVGDIFLCEMCGNHALTAKSYMCMGHRIEANDVVKIVNGEQFAMFNGEVLRCPSCGENLDCLNASKWIKEIPMKDKSHR